MSNFNNFGPSSYNIAGEDDQIIEDHVSTGASELPVVNQVPDNELNTMQNALKDAAPNENNASNESFNPLDYECTDCKQTFRRRAVLEHHQVAKHGKGKDKMDRKQTRVHLASTNNSQSHRCPYCRRVLHNRGAFTNHIRSHKRWAFTCEPCQVAFTDSQQLQKHIGRFHASKRPRFEEQAGELQASETLQVSAENSNAVAPGQSERNVVANERSTTCTQNSNFSSVQSRSSTPSTTSTTTTSSTTNNSQKPAHICPHCQKVFRILGSLTNHIRSHQKWAFTCGQTCKAAFTSAQQLHEHIQQNHPSQRSEVLGEQQKASKTASSCFYCGELFYGRLSGKALAKHIRFVHHSGAKSQCPQCGQLMMDKGRLSEHVIRWHTSHRPFRCNNEGCERAFVTKGELGVHLLVHSREKPHVCAVCRRAFSLHSNLVQHRKKQHPGVDFVTSTRKERKGDKENKKRGRPKSGRYFILCSARRPPTSVTLSAKPHSRKQRRGGNIRSHRCAHCPKRFVSARGLEIHTRNVHSLKLLLFACEICDTAFTTKRNLVKHYRFMHGKDIRSVKKTGRKERFEPSVPLRETSSNLQASNSTTTAESTAAETLITSVQQQLSTNELLPSEPLSHHEPSQDSQTNNSRSSSITTSQHSPLPPPPVMLNQNGEEEVPVDVKPVIFFCPYCPRGFTAQYSHTVHLRSHPETQEITKKQQQQQNESEDFDDLQEQQKQQQQENENEDSDDLQEQQQNESGDSADLEDQQQNLMDTEEQHCRKQASTASDHSFQCPVNCGQHFADEAALEKHRVKHLYTVNYNCLICGQLMESREELANHMNGHTGEKKKKKLIPVTLVSTDTHSRTDSQGPSSPAPPAVNLKLNNVLDGTPPKLIRCNLCVKSFRYASSLETHLLYSHSTVKSSGLRNNRRVGNSQNFIRDVSKQQFMQNSGQPSFGVANVRCSFQRQLLRKPKLLTVLCE